MTSSFHDPARGPPGRPPRLRGRRVRGVPTVHMTVRRVSTKATLLAQAQARLAALPPGFTDHLRHAPPFPPDAPEILGGD